MHHDDPRAQLLRQVLGPDQLAPRVAAPDPLGDQQAGRVHGEHRHAVVVRQPPEHVDVLADRVRGDHHLDPVVAEAGRDLERVRRPVREDGRGGQRHQASRRRIRMAHHDSFRNWAAPARSRAALASLCGGGAAARAPRAGAGVSAPGPDPAQCRQPPVPSCPWRRLRPRPSSARSAAGGPPNGPGAAASARPGARWSRPPRRRLLGRARRRGGAGRRRPRPPGRPDRGRWTPRAAGARPTGLDELDRVLGGGLVPGAVVLLAGEPGVGKSTLLLEAGALAAAVGPGAVRHRRGVGRPGPAARRPDRRGRGRTSTSRPRQTLGALLGHVAVVQPQLLIVDSVQTITADGVDGTPGGVTQIREVTAALMAVAKQQAADHGAGRPRHQGRLDRRAAGAGAPGGCRAALRGRPARAVPDGARGEEPVRPDR